MTIICKSLQPPSFSPGIIVCCNSGSDSSHQRDAHCSIYYAKVCAIWSLTWQQQMKNKNKNRKKEKWKQTKLSTFVLVFIRFENICFSATMYNFLNLHFEEPWCRVTVLALWAWYRLLLFSSSFLSCSTCHRSCNYWLCEILPWYLLRVLF